MSFLDRIKNIVNVDEDGYYPDDDVDTGAFLGDFEEEERPARQPRRAPRNNDQEKVVNIHTTAQLQVVLFSLRLSAIPSASSNFSGFERTT